MFVGLSNLMPMSKVVQVQYPQARIHGPCCAPASPPSRVLTVSGEVQTGQLKQLRAHLFQDQRHRKRPVNILGLPVAIRPHTAARRFKEAIWTEPADYLLSDASWTLDLPAVFAIQQVFWRKE